jgi:hypothetical protein
MGENLFGIFDGVDYFSYLPILPPPERHKKTKRKRTTQSLSLLNDFMISRS